MEKDIVLEDYQISATNGFLPSEPPLQRLPSYYDAWEFICSNLYKLRVSNKMTSDVACMPMLSTKYLTGEPQWRRAYVLLGYIAHAYIWGPEDPLEILPANVAVPLLAVSEHLGMAPASTYAAENMWNYRHIDPSQSIENPDNFSALTTFTDSKDESWFLSVPAAIEVRGAPIVPRLLEAFHAVSLNQSNELRACLQDIHGHIAALTVILPRMYEHCDPDYFFKEIRPFLAGTTGAKLPRGVLYEQENGSGEYLVLGGPTAAQSPLFHLLDIAFGVRHRPTGSVEGVKEAENASTHDEDQFLKKMRNHMPRGHRQFLEDVSKIANIRGFVISQTQDAALQDAYDSCLRELTAYRNKHVQIVSRYIVVPSRAASRLPPQETKPGFAGRVLASDNVPAKQEALGTGGTAPVKFLKQVRNETQESLLGKK